METIPNQNTEREAFRMAQLKVKKLKKFYVHLIVYLLVNAFFLIVNYHELEPNEKFFSFDNFSVAICWGIGLAAHAFSVFVPHFILGNNWEKKKMQQFMEQEKNSNKWE